MNDMSERKVLVLARTYKLVLGRMNESEQVKEESYYVIIFIINSRQIFN